MRQLSFWKLLLAMLILFSPALSHAQDSTGHRKVVNRVAPDYPVLARTIKLSGVVRVEVLVAPDGSVKSVDLRGGHPLLAQAAVDAVRHWKWEPGAHESHESVEVKFTP